MTRCSKPSQTVKRGPPNARRGRCDPCGRCRTFASRLKPLSDEAAAAERLVQRRLGDLVGCRTASSCRAPSTILLKPRRAGPPDGTPKEISQNRNSDNLILI